MISVGGASGEIVVYNYYFSEPHSIYNKKFANRVGLTTVLIRDLESDKKVKFKCKELVKNISINNEFLAVHTPSRILLYQEVVSNDDAGDGSKNFSYKNVGKLDRKVDGEYFILLSDNFIIGHENKIRCFDFDKNLTREWTYNSNITYMLH